MIVAPGLLLAGAGVPGLDWLERRYAGRLGVFAQDSVSGRTLAHQPDVRFLMCSTFKMLAAGALLRRVDQQQARLETKISYGARDLIGWSPVAHGNLAAGFMTLEQMCAAAVSRSDNGAANLLLRQLGGPGAVTAFCRDLGDAVTRLDRWEPALNTAHGVLDTTTPRAMAGLAKALVLEGVLSAESREKLRGWMVGADTGLARLRAGFPKEWVVGDKTGTGGGIANDVAVVWPPGRAAWVVAAYYDAPHLSDTQREDVLRQVGGIVAGVMGV